MHENGQDKGHIVDKYGIHLSDIEFKVWIDGHFQYTGSLFKGYGVVQSDLRIGWILYCVN